MQDHVEQNGPPPVRRAAETAGAPDESLSDRTRWLAACAYLFVLSIFVLYEAKQRPEDEYLRFHARQGFAIFFVEFALVVVSTILDHSVGRIDTLGVVVMVTYNLCTGLLGVGVSVMGFVNALLGERWTLPVLGDYAKRVPLS
jgi:uncharacterized membrane protein